MTEQENLSQKNETLREKIDQLTIDGLREALEKHGLYYSNDVVRTLFYALHNSDTPVIAVLLEGAPGVGKTALTEALADILGAEYLIYQFTPQTNEKSLYYDIVPNENTKGGFSKEPGVLMKAVQASQTRPVIVTLDEIDKADETTDSFLLSFLQNASLPIGTETLKGNPNNMIVFLTSNNMRQLADPLRRRVLSLDVEPPPPTRVLEVMSQKYPIKIADLLTALYGLSLKLWHGGEVSRPLSIQDLRHYGGYLMNVKRNEGYFPALSERDFYRFLYKNYEDAKALFFAVESGGLKQFTLKPEKEEKKVELGSIINELAGKISSLTPKEEKQEVKGEVSDVDVGEVVPVVFTKVNDKLKALTEPEFPQVDLNNVEGDVSGFCKNTGSIRDCVYKMFGALKPDTECTGDSIKGEFGECNITKDAIIVRRLSLKALPRSAEEIYKILIQDNSATFVFEDELPSQLEKNKLKQIAEILIKDGWQITGFKDTGEEKFLNAKKNNQESTQAINIISKNGKTKIFYGIQGNNLQNPEDRSKSYTFHLEEDGIYVKTLEKILEEINKTEKQEEQSKPNKTEKQEEQSKPNKTEKQEEQSKPMKPTYDFTDLSQKLFDILSDLDKSNYKEKEKEIMNIASANNFNDAIENLNNYYRSIDESKSRIIRSSARSLFDKILPQKIQNIINEYKDIFTDDDGNPNSLARFLLYFPENGDETKIDDDNTLFASLRKRIEDTDSIKYLRRIEKFINEYADYLYDLARLSSILTSYTTNPKYRIAPQELKHTLAIKKKLLTKAYSLNDNDQDNDQVEQLADA